jgi:preprotein translocase subunit SecG
MLLPLAFVLIAVFIVIAIVLIIRKSKGKKELNKETVSNNRVEEGQAGGTETESDHRGD